ncbi:transposase [Thiocapsa sp.]|uniref:transposase n=1 Tax=Thiocapsa sp. TaxID=2024551 RepID=UPI003593544B
MERRRRWSAAEKLRLVAESYRADGGSAAVAGRADVHLSLLQRWRREARDGTLVADRPAAHGFVPAVLAGGEGGAVSHQGSRYFPPAGSSKLCAVREGTGLVGSRAAATQVLDYSG